jgi:hypothetical protein
MRRFLSSAIALCYVAIYVISPFALAQTSDAPLFELIVPSTAWTNEAFDVTVKAKNADGTINTTYVGGIFFSVNPGESGATIPANIESSDSEFTFSLSEQWQHTFSKAFIFPKEGSYEITVTDNETFAEVTQPITITASGTVVVDTASVNITEPVSQDTVNSSSLMVAGNTTPTSTVNFFVGTEKKGSTISNTEGEFSGTVSGLAEGINTIKVEVMDGTGKSVGSSSVTVNYSLDAPKINSLIIKEGNQVFVGSTIHLEAVGDPGLKTVTVQFGDKPVVLVEDSTRLGVYTGITQMSNFEGEVRPVVNVESFQGTQASFSDLVNINVISSSFENVKVEATPDKKVQFTFSLKTDLDEIMYFKIKYGTQSGQYDKEVVTYEKTQIKSGEQYIWYIPWIDQGEYYSTIIGLDKDKQELSINSGEQVFSLLNSAETCFIDKVSGVTVKTSGSKSIISWDTLDDAASYQIFKKDSDWEYAMIDEVTDTTYTVNIDMSAEEEIFEDFQIRATCKNGNITGEGAYSESVAVQTWPAAIAFMMLLIASGVSFILMKRGYLR